MGFGGSTITLVKFVENTSGGRDELGNYPLEEVTTAAPGCRHRPLTFTEMVEMQFDVATKPWRSTIPLLEYDDDVVDALLALQPQDVVRVDGVEYEIVAGVRHFPDRWGNPFKGTMISQQQV